MHVIRERFKVAEQHHEEKREKVSALHWGKLDGFSTDRLFRFLNAMGRDVEIVIRPARHEGDTETRVISA